MNQSETDVTLNTLIIIVNDLSITPTVNELFHLDNLRETRYHVFAIFKAPSFNKQLQAHLPEASLRYTIHAKLT